MPKKYTGDGRRIYAEFKDADDDNIAVVGASSGPPRVWIFGTAPYLAPYLTPSQARRLAKALNRFADECEGKEKK